MFSITMMALGLILLAFALALLTMRSYRRRRDTLQRRPEPLLPAFDMPQLRAMRDGGTISRDEFERLREANLRQMSR